MNPWAFVIIGIGLMVLIIGIKGTQHSVIPAITGHASGSGGKPNPNVRIL